MKPKITLYQHTNYNKGYSGTPWKKSYTDPVPDLGSNANKASSAIVEHGAWILYSESDYGEGKSKVLYSGHYPDHDHLGVGNDDLHSLRPLPNRGICLFEKPKFAGKMVHVEEGEENKSFEAGSAIVRSGEWALHTNKDFSGDTVDAKVGEYSALPIGLHGKKIKSVKASTKGNLVVVSSKDTKAGGGTLDPAKEYDLGDKPSVELIVDASGSMRDYKMDYHGKSVTRMVVAKDVLQKVVNDDLPDGILVALRIFGPGNLDGEKTTAGRGVTTLSQTLQPLNREALIGKIESINADGWTPIAASIEKVKDDLKSAPGSKLVVLVTDGNENCGGDVLKTIEQLRLDGVEVVLNIVGFAIGDDTLKQKFKDWAEAGNGHYYDATESADLHKEMKKALQIRIKVWKPPFKVIAEGYVDGDAIELEPGIKYAIQLLPGDENFIQDVLVNSGETTEVLVNRG